MAVNENQNTGFKIVKYFFKGICMLLIFGTIGLLLWRMFSSGDPKSMKTLIPNATLVAVWESAEAEGRDLTMYTQELDGITRAEHNYGYFSVSNVVFIEEAEQVQVTFRYNNSTIRHLVEDYALSETPNREEDLYDVSLYVAYDLTPDVTEDNLGNDPESVSFVRIHPTHQTADTKNIYNYRKFVFDGVDMANTENPILAVYVDVYYKEDVSYDKDSYGTLIIFDHLTEKESYELSGSDVDALKDFE